MARRRKKPKKPPKCRGLKVWAYPKTEDNAGPIDWAWACGCGKHGAGFPSVDAASNAANEHLKPEDFQASLDKTLAGSGSG